MWQFLAGIRVGGIIGVFVMCLMVSAGNADRREERFYDGSRKD
ncbi:MAG: DUF3789 domain-containing protein [Oscillospiraceae bacterium]|nr:DUF3789 domain-containing protein [Oscillospiraceae bacterium]